MATLEDKAKLPVPRERSFLQAAVRYLAVPIILAGLLYFAISMLSSSADDDRPPIIVRNGSVAFEVAQHGGGGTKGTLKMKGSSNKTWVHDLPGKKVKKMEVSVQGSDPAATNPCSPTPYFFAQNVKGITIHYTYTTSAAPDAIEKGDLDVSVNSDEDLEVGIDSAGDATQPAGQDYKLLVDAGTGATLQAVSINFNNGNGNPNSLTCTFGGNLPPEIRIFQRK